MNKQLMAIQQELKVPKGQYNSFGGFNYRSLEDIYEALKPLTAKHGAEIFMADEVMVVGDRVYVKATATFRSEDGEVIGTAYAREPLTKKGMDESQVTGTASSYARKYALAGLLLIDDTKDADTDEYVKITEHPRKATPKQIEVLKSKYTGANLKKLLETNGVEKIEDIPLEKASDLIKKLGR